MSDLIPSNIELVDIKKMAKILAVPVSWIYQRTRLGSKAIPFVRVGKYVRFNPDEVVKYFKVRQKSESSRIAKTKELGRIGATEEEMALQDAKDKEAQAALPFPLTNPTGNKEKVEMLQGLSLEAEQKGMKLSDLLLEKDEKWLKEQKRGKK